MKYWQDNLEKKKSKIMFYLLASIILIDLIYFTVFFFLSKDISLFRKKRFCINIKYYSGSG